MSQLYLNTIKEIGFENTEALLVEIAAAQNLSKPEGSTITLYLFLYEKLHEKLDQLLRAAYTRFVVKEIMLLNAACVKDNTKENYVKFMTYAIDKDCLMSCDRFRSRFMLRMLQSLAGSQTSKEMTELFNKHEISLEDYEQKNFNLTIEELVLGETEPEPKPTPYTAQELLGIINETMATTDENSRERVDAIKKFLDSLLTCTEIVKHPKMTQLIGDKLMQYIMHPTYGNEFRPYIAKFDAIIPGHLTALNALNEAGIL